MNNKKPNNLKQVLGISFGIAILIGNCVGIGILRMPGTIAGYINNEHLILGLWVLGGVLAMIGAMVYAEASVANPKAGGPYVIVEKALGKQAGFTVGMSDWIYNNASNAALSIAVSEYYVTLSSSTLSTTFLASFLIVILTIVQWFGIKSSDAIQKGLSLLKAIGLLFLVFAFYSHESALTQTTGITNTSTNITIIGAIILSFRAIVITYGGWNAPIYFAEENTNPSKSLPKALIYGVLSITIIYFLINAALMHLIPLSSYANSTLAIADGAKVVFGENGKIVVTIVSIVIVIGALYAGLLFAPRIIFGKSRSGLFFLFASKINRFNIPGLALLATSVITILFAASGTFEFVIAVSVFLYVFIDTSVYISAFYSRWKNIGALAYQAKGFPYLYILMILVNLALLTGVIMEDFKSSAYAIGIILLTIPLYYAFNLLNKKSI
jgi:APA family basic amino acid/polyamine antiporter